MAITTIELGKVLITHKGVWVSGASYEKLDVVSINDSSYLCISNASSGITLDNTAYWKPLSIGAYEYAVSEGYEGTIDQFAADLADVSNKINISDIANNLTTTDEGKALDARQGKVLNDGKVDKTSIKQTLGTSETDIMSQKFVTSVFALISDGMEDAVAAALVELYKRVVAIETLLKSGEMSSATIKTLDVLENLNVQGNTNLLIKGSGAPGYPPDRELQFYIKTSAPKAAYISTGTSSVSDWLLIG